MTREKRQGTVVWFNDKRGIGFIDPENGEKDFFVHFTNVVTEPNQFKTLVAGQKVTFVVGANKKGPQAEEVTVIEEPDISEE
jgi:CspA family cold shock protein